MYRLLLRVQLSRARVLALVGGGLLAIVVAAVLRGSGQSNLMQVGALLIGEYGLWLLIPITALLLSSATLGENYDEGTLVYLWLRPAPRWMIAKAAYLSSRWVASSQSSRAAAISSAGPVMPRSFTRPRTRRRTSGTRTPRKGIADLM